MDMKRSAEEAHGPLQGGGVLHGDHGVGHFDAEAEEFVEVLHLLVEILARSCGFVLGTGGAVAQAAIMSGGELTSIAHGLALIG